MNAQPVPVPDIDAAMVIGMASAAIPFARSREDQAERWLRILRMHGEAGMALHELGVSEGPVEGEHAQHEASSEAPAGDVVADVSDAAARAAEQRGSHAVETRDVLIAVMDIYGGDFDHVLSAHGAGREELIQRLALQAA